MKGVEFNVTSIMCNTKLPLLLLLRASADPQGSANTSESQESERR